MVTTKTNTLGVILSGGAGTRLKGVDKGLQPFKELSLVEHVINSLSPQTSALLICANRNLETYASFGHTVIRDQNQQRYEGPLAGITAAIEHVLQHQEFSSVEQLLISPCDVPNPPNDLCERLNASQNQVALAHDGDRKQNLHCLIHRQQWSSLSEFYINGGRAIHRWFTQVDAVEVDFSDQANRFRNLNRIEQIQQA